MTLTGRMMFDSEEVVHSHELASPVARGSYLSIVISSIPSQFPKAWWICFVFSNNRSAEQPKSKPYGQVSGVTVCAIAVACDRMAVCGAARLRPQNWKFLSSESYLSSSLPSSATSWEWVALNRSISSTQAARFLDSSLIILAFLILRSHLRHGRVLQYFWRCLDGCFRVGSHCLYLKLLRIMPWFMWPQDWISGWLLPSRRLLSVITCTSSFTASFQRPWFRYLVPTCERKIGHGAKDLGMIAAE